METPHNINKGSDDKMYILEITHLDGEKSYEAYSRKNEVEHAKRYHDRRNNVYEQFTLSDVVCKTCGSTHDVNKSKYYGIYTYCKQCSDEALVRYDGSVEYYAGR